MQQVSPTLQTTSNDVPTEVREKKTQCNLTTLVTNDQAFKALGDTAGQEQEKTRFFKFIRPDFWTDLNGCRQRLLFARQLIPRKCSLCSQGTCHLKVSISFFMIHFSISTTFWATRVTVTCHVERCHILSRFHF